MLVDIQLIHIQADPHTSWSMVQVQLIHVQAGTRTGWSSGAVRGESQSSKLLSPPPPPPKASLASIR